MRCAAPPPGTLLVSTKPDWQCSIVAAVSEIPTYVSSFNLEPEMVMTIMFVLSYVENTNEDRVFMLASSGAIVSRLWTNFAASKFDVVHAVGCSNGR